MPVDTHAFFYEHSKLDGQHFYDTKEERFDDVVMVEIFIKGSSKASHSKEVFDKDGTPLVIDNEGNTYLDLYPRAYNSFMKGQAGEIDGTPLRNMGGLGPSQVKNLANQGIETVEDLAELSDNVVLGEQGMLDMRKKAQAFMASLHPEKLAAKEKEAKDEIEAMRLEVAQMREALANATIPPDEGDKPKRKRRKRNPETGELE